ncbi:type II toxin-antitoxin system VapC family toxin [Streptomyces aidingensis]|uniref:Ribonuclease VapC n=1 Tax=Streptomyces aidingensis TaxID=910347 RepID=A0A1I1LFE5_9ACTN|nr:type II toxin-antitoxin system VapC family toxin [Streptomyces aidingensis]SFC69073.1 Predicted nucleic acid-binding protein, contains PIN domain [Streptomyces aidingensis]
MIVVDAGAVAHLVADAGPVGEAVRKRVEAERLAAPHLLDVEVASALRGRHRGGKLSDVQLDMAWDSFALLPIRRMEHMPVMPRVRELWNNLSPYDATYVALAEGLGVPLITSDARIERAGRARCPVEVFTDHRG